MNSQPANQTAVYQTIRLTSTIRPSGRINKSRFVWTVEVECLDCQVTGLPTTISRTAYSDVSQSDAKRSAENLAWTEFDMHAAARHQDSRLVGLARRSV
jgi:hypothetical protein